MSGVLTLTWRGVDVPSLEVEGVAPDRLATLSETEIGALPAWVGSERRALGEFFSIAGTGTQHVRVVGDVARVHGIGADMVDGELVIDGPAGHRTGAGMRGGALEVRGAVGDDCGAAMAGGLLRVRGDAGRRLGAALPGASRGMSGGEIVVDGSVGDDVAARARRGLIVVGGNTGASAGRAMIAGTLVVMGRVGPSPVAGNKRGSLVALGAVAVPATYRYACTYEPTYVRLLMTHLQRRHDLTIEPRWRDGSYRRYCGDLGQPGKGEILALAD